MQRFYFILFDGLAVHVIVHGKSDIFSLTLLLFFNTHQILRKFYL